MNKAAWLRLEIQRAKEEQQNEECKLRFIFEYTLVTACHLRFYADVTRFFFRYLSQMCEKSIQISLLFELLHRCVFIHKNSILQKRDPIAKNKLNFDSCFE